MAGAHWRRDPSFRWTDIRELPHGHLSCTDGPEGVPGSPVMLRIRGSLARLLPTWLTSDSGAKERTPEAV